MNQPGSVVIRANVLGTAVFVVSATLSAALFDGVWKVQGVVVALTLFAAGVFAFLSSYWTAVQRSRHDELSVAELYFLTGSATPGSVKAPMLWSLAVQVLAALATALARPNTDGKAGSVLAFGVLVPMFGLGLNGLWAARHAAFGPRRLKPKAPRIAPSGDDDRSDDGAPTTTGAEPGGDAVTHEADPIG